MIPDSVIETVRERVDIVSVVGRRVTLKRVGRNHVGLCPFHGEKTPSFYVNPERRSYHCFGCGEGGDVFRFLCRLEGRAFPEVVRELAKDAGVTIPEAEETPEERAREALRQRLFALQERAAAFFQAELSGPGGAEARAYLETRELGTGLAAEFELGFGGAGWDGLWKALGKTEQDRNDLIAAGLIVVNDRGAFDRFRGRIIFPIRDEKNRLVGFGGRVFGDGAKREGVAKYVNSSQSPVYDKSTALYRAPQALARVRKGAELVLVEGYFDAIALERCGLATVATCGTSVTTRHAAFLARHKAKVVLCWDGDEAGMRAVRKAAEVLLPAGIPARVAALPVNDDPDTYVARTGTEGAARLVDEAEALPAYVIAQVASGVEDAGDDVPARLEAVRSLAWLFRALPAGLERDLYLGQAAKRLYLEKAQLDREFARSAPPAAPAPLPPEIAPPAPGQGIPARLPQPAVARLSGHERTLVRLVLEHSGSAARFLDAGITERMSAPVLDLLAAARGLWQEAAPPMPNSDANLALRAAGGHPEIAMIFDDVRKGQDKFPAEAVELAVQQTILHVKLDQFRDQLHSIQRELAAELEKADGQDQERLEQLSAQAKEVKTALLDAEKKVKSLSASV